MKKTKAAAYTLVETMVTIAMITLTGLGIFLILRTGMILGAKNTSMNLTHEQSRYGLLRMQQDVLQAVDNPVLTDTTGTVTASGSAPGVSFPINAGGPFCLYGTSASGTISNNATSIQVITEKPGFSGTNFQPLPGEIIYIQASPISGSLVTGTLSGTSPYTGSSTSSGYTYTINLTAPIGTTIPVWDTSSSQSGALNVACWFAKPIYYAVVNGTLMRYQLNPNGNGQMVGTAYTSGIASANPFSLPTINASPAASFILVSNLVSSDPTTSNRGYKALNTPFNVQFPILTPNY